MICVHSARIGNEDACTRCNAMDLDIGLYWSSRRTAIHHTGLLGTQCGRLYGQAALREDSMAAAIIASLFARRLTNVPNLVITEESPRSNG